MKTFLDKYKPGSAKDIPQNLEIIKKLIKDKKPILIYGPTGSCKTSSVYAIAKEMDYEIIEVNASDFRTKEQINKTIGEASQQQSLFQKEKIILIEEADCLAGRDDYGGAQAILEVLKNTKFAVIITANDLYNDKLKDIKKAAAQVEFKPINSRLIFGILKNICTKEKINYSEEILNKIAANSKGDLRAAINDLQGNIAGKDILYQDEEREYEQSVISILSSILKSKDFESYKLLEKNNLDLDEYTLWLDENLPLEYKNPEDLERAYELLSKSNIFKKRITRWQYWRLMYYQSLLLTSGISIIKSNSNNNYTSFKRPMRPLRIWQFNMKNSRKKTISNKLAALTHTSTKDIMNNFRYYKDIINNKEAINELKLTEDEIDYIKSLN